MTVTIDAPAVMRAGAESYSLRIAADVFAAAVKATATAADMSAYAPASFDTISVSLYADETWELAATDRYRLTVCGNAGDSADRVSNALLPARELLAFAKGMKVPKRGTVEPVCIVFGTDAVYVEWDGMVKAWNREDLPTEYPNYQKLLATVTPATPSAEWAASCWNPSFLADGAEACRLMSDGKNVPVRFTCPNPSKPVTMEPTATLAGLSFVYLLMPVRVQG